MSEENIKKTKWVKVTVIIFAVLFVIFAAGYAYINAKLNLIRRNEPVEVVKPEDEFFETDDVAENDTEDNIKDNAEKVDPDEILWPVDEDVMKDADIKNILLIGQDRRPGEKRARSDSMMLATINKKNKTVKITSLMRDMYVQIPGYSDNRINASYAFGGMELLNATIEKNFLVHVDGNIEVDFDGFQQVIDKIGGVEITLNKKEAEHLRKNGFPDVQEGKVLMDGKLALAYSRIRKVGNSDYERTERQRRVITAAFAKVKSLPFTEINNLINEIFPLVNTDLTNTELISLAFNVFLLNPDTIGTYRIPVDNSYKSAWIRGMLVLVPDLEKNRQALKDIIYGD